MPDCVCLCLDRKLAKKRKDAIGTTRQEMTHMVNAMDRSYADQSTLHGEDPMAVTFMDSHNYNNRCMFILDVCPSTVAKHETFPLFSLTTTYTLI